MGPIEPIIGGLTVLIIFLGLSSPIIIIGLIYYLKKRLEHKQIMAAIEKGTPLSELKPVKPTGPLWIKNFTVGIALLIVSVGIVCIWLVRFSHEGYDYDESFGFFVVAVALFAFGIGFFTGRWSKLARSEPHYLDVTGYTTLISVYPTSPKAEDSFWRQKALAAMQPRPYAQTFTTKAGLLNAYKQYLKEKYHD